MTAISSKRVVAAWYDLVARRSGPDIQRFDRIVLTGCLLEIARPRPSTPEIASMLRCSHSTVLEWFRIWNEMPWRDRAQWLDFIERSCNHVHR